jgi:hypothetical protein
MNVLVTGSSDSRTLRELTVVRLDVVAGPVHQPRGLGHGPRSRN